jgi:hypothetical protein
MAIIVGGFSDGTGAEVETTHRALRAINWPYDVVALNEERGSYSLGMDNGNTVITAGAQTDQEIFQFRWVDPLSVAAVRSFKLNFGTQIAFVAGKFKLDLFFASAWTAAGTGGTTATVTGRNLRKRTSFATTVLGEARIATTAVLGAGTKTLDTQPLATISAAAPTVIGPIFVGQSMLAELNRDTSDEYPVVLGFNEGLVVRTTYPATGTPFFGFQVEWIEYPANEFFG